MKDIIKYILCHNCGSSFEKNLFYRNCSNCFACTGCEIYTCPHCAGEIIVKPKKEAPKQEKVHDSHQDDKQ